MSSLAAAAAAATKFPPLLLDTSTKPVNSFSVKKGGRPHCQNQKGYTYSYSNQDQRQTRKQRKQRGDQSLQQVATNTNTNRDIASFQNVITVAEAVTPKSKKSTGNGMNINTRCTAPVHSPTKSPMPDFIIRELYGRSPQVLNNNNTPRTTERMKQMYSSLVSDSESSSCGSICSENSIDACSVSASNNEGETETAIAVAVAIAPLLNNADYESVVYPTINRKQKQSGKAFEIKRLRYENEHEMESHEIATSTCTPNKMAIRISPIQSRSLAAINININNKEEIDHEVNVKEIRSTRTYYETIQAEERQSKSGGKRQQSKSSTTIRKLTPSPAKDPRRDNMSSLQKSVSSGEVISEVQVQKRHSSPRGQSTSTSTLECRNPYYRSVQDTLEANGENKVVIYGKSPFHSDNQKILGRRLQDDDQDQRTLLTASETVTLISGDASHSNMTETGTVQSGNQDYETGLCLPMSTTCSPVKTKSMKEIGTENGHEVELDLGTYKLCPRVKGRAEAMEAGQKCDFSESSHYEYLKNHHHKYLDSRGGADEGSIAESTLVSLASDKVVSSIDISGDSLDVGEVPRDISFCHPKPVEYTSLRDLMSNTHKNEKSRKVTRSAEMKSNLGETACARDFHASNHDERCEEDNKKTSKLDKKDVLIGRCASLRPLQDIGFTSKSMLEKEYLPQDHEEKSGRVSNPATLQRNPSFYEEEKSISDVSIRNDIAIGSIKDLDVFRKARSTDDECKCTIM
mmetsp:Transcript_11410/g.17119  ORF Transcript_11410/g.17119 Transcript_11410/m.17119 type:complete len:744 (-) Transcript_11410:113-2344(-)